MTIVIQQHLANGLSPLPMMRYKQRSNSATAYSPLLIDVKMIPLPTIICQGWRQNPILLISCIGRISGLIEWIAPDIKRSSSLLRTTL